MFEYIRDEKLDVAIPAGYFAIQFIRQWAWSNAQYGGDVDFNELPDSQARLISKIIKEIKNTEGIDISSLPQNKIDKYINEISNCISEIAKSGLQAEEMNGAELLMKLRDTL